jgi:hypothetical protein
MLVAATRFVAWVPFLVFLSITVSRDDPARPYIVGIGAVFLVALTLLRSWLRVLCALGAVVAFVVLVVVAIGRGNVAPSPAHTYLILGARTPTVGVDVYCNDVPLGRTPLRISRKVFDAKVASLQGPPRQERLDIQDRQFNDAKYSQVPQDVFEQNAWMAPAAVPFFVSDEKQTLGFLKASRHWWHFEEDGHSGLGGLLNFGGGGGGSSAQYEIEANPDVTYPALAPHLDAMVEALRRTGYRPDDAWIAHFLKDQALFFIEFRKRADTDPRLMPALEACVRAEFALPQNPSSEDCARVLDEIMARAEARGAFQTPSMESMALDLMGEQAAAPLVRRFLSAQRLPARSYGWSEGDKWRIETGNGPAARLLPLEHLAGRLHPEALFAPLVYEYSRSGRFFALVAGYRSEAAASIFTRRLRTASGSGSDRLLLTGLLRDLADIRSPQIEEAMRDFMRDNATGQENAYYVRAFVKSRIGDPAIDQSELATWVFRWAPLKERDRIDLTLRIDSALTYHYLQMLGVSQDQSKRENAIGFLAQNPNASLDQFIIDSYHWYDGPEGPGYWSTSVSEALARTDTPATREFIRTTPAAGGEAARKLVGRLNDARGDLSTLAWMTDLFRDLTDPRMRADAAGILARVDTPAARQLLDAWAADADAGVARAAAQALDAHRERQALADLRFRQYGELLSDKIRPDDLLPPAQPWVWNGEAYVPEHPEADVN